MITRPVRPGDDRAVEAIFAETVALGRPLPFAWDGFERYADLCLSWYLGAGRDDVVVLEDDERVVGYALVCADGRAHRRWQRTAAASWALRATTDVLKGRLADEVERFCRLRLRDGWAGWIGSPPPCPAHLHVNVVAGHRGASAGRLLLDAAEERLRQAGMAQWYGEVNAIAGRRASALERHGARVVQRRPSLTMSWLAGRPVETLRVTRTVPPVAQSQPLRRKARYSRPETVAISASTAG